MDFLNKNKLTDSRNIFLNIEINEIYFELTYVALTFIL